MKKSFFDQFGKEIDKEAKTLKAHAEKTPIESKICDHSKAEMINGELRCPCGTAYSGGNLVELMKLLKIKV